MNREFERCVEGKKLFFSKDAKNLVSKELATARQDFEEAQDRYYNKRYKYCTITAYYSMFHSARALLFSRGYRGRSHYCLGVGLKALFVEKELLNPKLVRAFFNAMALRQDADYAADYSRQGADIVLKNAREFLRKAEEILMKE